MSAIERFFTNYSLYNPLSVALYCELQVEPDRKFNRFRGKVELIDMDQTSAFVNNEHQFETNIHDFIRIEVEVSITFATIALDSCEPEGN